MQKITPFMWFEKDAEEAMNFYVSLFPNSKIVNIKRYPTDMQVGPIPNMGGKILTGVFELMGQQFMCLDGGPFFKPTGAISYLVECENQEEIDKYWNALSAKPESEQCGWLQDKYGFSWQIVPDMTRWFNDKDKEASNRAMQAMLQMKKIDISKLDKAYSGQ